MDSVVKAGRTYVKVGWPSEDDKQHPDAGMTMAGLATLHEFGSEDGRIPSRPFMRKTFDAARETLHRRINGYKGAIAAGHFDAAAALGRLGEWYVGRLKAMIASGEFRPLAPSTILRKGSTKPLIDTGALRNSITWKLVRR